MEAFNADHATGYTGVTLTKSPGLLRRVRDQGNIKIAVATVGGYCVVNTVPGTVQYHKLGAVGRHQAG